MAETKIIYHIDEEETPYLVKLSIAPDKVTLADFKNVLSNRSVNSYKFFFKSMDQDFGVVKEEISDDNAKLPCFNGRVVSWLILAESSHSDGVSMCTESHPELPPPLERTGGIGDSRPPSFHAHAVSSREGVDTETGSESLLSHRREREREKARRRREEFPHVNGHSKGESVARDSAMGCDSGSVMSSELESSSFMDSEEEDASRLSSSTEKSSSSQLMRRHKRKRRRQKVNKIDRSSSFSSITDSTMSLNIITVTLNMEKYHFLGISIVGQSNDRGDGGIYIGSIMKGGAVAADARIEPGDMLLQVNDVNFENMSNDDAVRVLRDIVSKPGPISLTVAKCWDPSPRSYFTIPHTEPVRPIDPAAWISHTTALTGSFPQYEFDDLPLTVGKTDMATIVKVMQLPGSGLDIRDRMWLKITIGNAAIGAEVVDWLYSRVEGFKDRRDARKYASSLLKHGYLRHTVNKITFSDQCYYTFGDLCQRSRSSGSNPSMGKSQRLLPRERTRRLPGSGRGSESEAGTQEDGGRSNRSASQMSHSSHALSSNSHSHSHRSHSHSHRSHTSYVRGHSPFSRHASVAPSDHSHASSCGAPGLPPPYSLSRHTHTHTHTHARAHTHTHTRPPKGPVFSGPPGAPPTQELLCLPPELTASRQSFQRAMGNPCEVFVDIM
ncbi:segment polarity protein dishevelled homolog DVL-1b [Alosa pseudoharengus]|uniref:segment polarity protein dishevelled homolog DVL-1b n=1 Tax=Alosa pseudoharengus TaxID=34774 RepID=UPI003F8BA555